MIFRKYGVNFQEFFNNSCVDPLWNSFKQNPLQNQLVELITLLKLAGDEFSFREKHKMELLLIDILLILMLKHFVTHFKIYKFCGFCPSFSSV